MITDQSDAAILQTGYSAFASGDVGAVLAICADDVVWNVAGDSPISGSWVGHQGVVDFCTTVFERSAATLKVEVDEMFDNGTGTVVALSTISAERRGKSFAWPAAQVWQFDAGLVTSLQEFYAQQAEIDAFWS
jgi:ketosteroid isomerase-like protein